MMDLDDDDNNNNNKMDYFSFFLAWEAREGFEQSPYTRLTPSTTMLDLYQATKGLFRVL